jgi:hypothetical protein
MRLYKQEKLKEEWETNGKLKVLNSCDIGEYLDFLKEEFGIAKFKISYEYSIVAIIEEYK